MVNGEVATVKDMCHHRHYDDRAWEKCIGVVGTGVGSGSSFDDVYVFIRKGEPPKPRRDRKKVWLNPWD